MNIQLKLQVLIVAISTSFLTGCSGKTITTKNTDFSAEEDPICSIVRDLCSNFDIEERSVLGSHSYDCKVSVTLEPERHLATNVKAISNETKGIIYERSITKIDDESFNAEFKLYNPAHNYVIADFTGVVYTDYTDAFEDSFKENIKEVNWKEVGYYACLINYDFDEVNSGDLKFYTKSKSAKEPFVIKHVETSNYQVITTDYWPNGQKKLVKEYNREDKEITAAYNYNEDGSRGNPLEVASLINDRWIGFTSNLHNARTQDNLYLFLRADEDDWRYGKVMICFSKSGCQSNYTVYQKGDYDIDSSNHIRFYNMKNSRGGYANEFRLSIEGDSMTNITFRGTYEDNSTHFVSNLNMKNKSWFKSSLRSKYKMY